MCCPTFVSTSCCKVNSSSGSIVLPVFSLKVSQCRDFSAGLARACYRDTHGQWAIIENRNVSIVILGTMCRQGETKELNNTTADHEP